MRCKFAFLLLLALASAANSAVAAQPYVPEVLEPWRAWVLERHPEQNCPPRYDDVAIRTCVWMRSLGLDLTRTGGRFNMDVELFARATVLLPGGGDVWPTGVRTDDKAAVVTSVEGRPRLLLEPGRYKVNGTLAWTQLPDALTVPRQHGMLQLSVNGVAIAQPRQEGDRLWLGKATAASGAVASDALTVRVYRELIDGIPMRLNTYLALSVAGTHRIVSLGRALPEEFAALAIDSALAARLDANGRLDVQVEPGEWRISVSGRALGSPASFTATGDTPDWPAEEIWGFQADRALRVVDLEGADPIDLSQTQAPFADVPAFVVTKTNPLLLIERFRGDPNPSPNNFTLSRDIWLAFDGDSYTVADTLNGTVQQPTRLSAAFLPGRITVDETPQLITELDDAAPGVELGSGQHRIAAVSQMPRAAFDTAVGWHTDVANLSGELHLPPGWRLLWTRGVDRAPTAWLATWTLWDIFLVVITVVLALRLLGRPAAAITLLTLVLAYHEPSAPIVAWPALLLLLAAVRAARGRLLPWLRAGYYAVLLLTTLSVLDFAVDNFRMAIYPQLGATQWLPLPASAPSEAYDMAAPARGRVAEEKSVMMSMASNAPKLASPRQYQTNTQVQTGPGIPAWRWVDAPLTWDGPVTATQPLTLALAPPPLTRAWHIVAPVLLALLLVIFAIATAPPGLPAPAWLKRLAAPTAAAFLLAPLILGYTPPTQAADLPTAQLLKDLERRLTAAPPCLPGCAALAQADVQLEGDTLRVQLVLHAAVDVALPLPAPSTQWWPSAVRDGDRPATLSRDDSGTLTVALTPGVHHLELSGAVVAADRFELPFPMRPGTLSLSLEGWRAFGAQDGYLRGAALQFERDTPAPVSGAGTAAASLAPEPVTPYFRLSRSFDFGLEWRIHSTLTRVAPAAGGIPFAVPLVSGEALLDGSVRSEAGRIVGVLAPDAQSISWESALAQTPELELAAPAVAVWSEQWTLIPSNYWHVAAQGVAPLKLDVGAAPGPRFAPAGGETLTITIERPTPVPGETITVESASLHDEPGARARRSTLALSVLSSQGGNYPVTIPAGAKILDISVDGRSQPIPTAAESVPLPVIPGRQQLAIRWEVPSEIGVVTRTSAIVLAGAATNIAMNVSLPGDRWPLLVGGPRLGPAVLFWGVLLVVLGVAVTLSRIKGLPLTTTDALLLGFGMTLCNLPSTLLIAAWLLLLLGRQRYGERLHQMSNSSFQMIQTLIGLVSVAALIALAASVPAGLLGTPDMQVVGNGSSAYDYRWYQDQANPSLPDAFIMSLPMWMYRVVMLAWSLWLAFAVVRWARWAWDAFRAGGIWKSRATVSPS